jgi:hypothetical protein
MLKFEIRNSIVDEEIVGEDDLELVSNFGVDTVNMREIEMQEKKNLNKLKKNSDLKKEKRKTWMKKEKLKKCKCN